MSDDDLSKLLDQNESDGRANGRLMEALYAELRAIADRLMNAERREHTLQATALVHEAFLRMFDAEKVSQQGHLHFLDCAAVTMRRVLVDHSRRTKASKRGGGDARRRITLSEIAEDDPEMDDDGIDVAQLDDALIELEQLDARQAKIVELRFFGGMSGDQIAAHFGISRSTVVREIAFARAWLRRRMKP